MKWYSLNLIYILLYISKLTFDFDGKRHSLKPIKVSLKKPNTFFFIIFFSKGNLSSNYEI